MSERLKTNLPFLIMVERVNNKQRKALLAHTSREEFRAIITLLFNILEGHVPVTETDKTRLRRYKKCIRTLVSKKISAREKRALLNAHHCLLPICVRSLLTYFDNSPSTTAVGNYDKTDGSANEGQLPEVNEQPEVNDTDVESTTTSSDSESASETDDTDDET